MNQTPIRRVAIVDGTGAGQALLRELLERNVECLHLRPHFESAAFDPVGYDGDLGFAGDVSEAISLLSELTPTAVLAGSPCATGYAEAVADGLGLPTHSIERFAARRYVESLLRAARPETKSLTGRQAQVVRGQQFVVNTVSNGGSHHITDAWRLLDIREDEVPGPGALELCDPASAITADVFDRARVALDDLGVRFGAAHAQFALSAKGLGLVGATASLMSLGLPGAPASGSRRQAAVWADCLVSDAPAALRQTGDLTYRPTRRMAVLLFRFRRRARVTDLDGLERLKRLTSFASHESPLALGEIVEPRTTWRGQGGLVHLIHDDPAQIGADIRQFRAWEARAELYGLGPLIGTEDSR